MDAQPQKIISQIGEINERLKSLRKSLKIKQKDFSFNLGLNQSYYSDVENGKKSVTSRIIQALREKYNISSEWMYTGKEPQNISNDDMECTPENVHPMYTLEKGTILEDKHGRKFYDPNSLTDDQIIKIWSDPNRNHEVGELDENRNAALLKSIDKHRVVADLARKSLEAESPTYAALQKDTVAIQTFEDLYNELYGNDILRNLCVPGSRYIEFKDIDTLKSALNADLQRLSPYIEAVAALAASFKAFVVAVEPLGEEMTGLAVEAIASYKKLNG